MVCSMSYFIIALLCVLLFFFFYVAIVHKSVHWRGPKGSRRRLEVQTHTEMDPADHNYLEQYKKFIIFEIDDKKNKAVFREFHLEPSGAILEIFEARGVNNQNRSIFSSTHGAEGKGEEGESEGEKEGVGAGAEGAEGDADEGEHVDQTDREGGSKEDEFSQHSDEDSPRRDDALATEKSPLLALGAGATAGSSQKKSSLKVQGAQSNSGGSSGRNGRDGKKLSVRVDTSNYEEEPDVYNESGDEGGAYY